MSSGRVAREATKLSASRTPRPSLTEPSGNRRASTRYQNVDRKSVGEGKRGETGGRGRVKQKKERRKVATTRRTLKQHKKKRKRVHYNQKKKLKKNL